MRLDRLGAGSWEIVAQRAMWSAPWALALVLAAGQGGQALRILRQPKTLGLLFLSAVSIAIGWGLYVWAVNNGHNLDSSLGYYITPLMNMAAGAVFFRERIDRFGATAIALAVAGVAIQTVALGRLPVISLVLAVAFWIYGLIRREVNADAQAGLLVECLFIAGPGVAYVAWLGWTGGGLFGHALGPSLLLATLGPLTVIPLALFAQSARRLPFAILGFLQYISPTLGFLIGAETGEALTPLRLVSFGFIWVGAATFTYGAWRASRRVQSPS
jgi:chloramphenicol-sensitive protein RarD